MIEGAIVGDVESDTALLGSSAATVALDSDVDSVVLSTVARSVSAAGDQTQQTDRHSDNGCLSASHGQALRAVLEEGGGRQLIRSIRAVCLVPVGQNVRVRARLVRSNLRLVQPEP